MTDPSGTLIERSEIEDDGDVRIVRGWHPNGTLVKEERCKLLPDGRIVLNGLTRRWNSAGELVGSYEVVNGNGVQREWYDNGQIRFENPLVNGLLTGMSRAWDEGGYLIVERFYYRGGPVSKKRYAELQKSDSTIPKYAAAEFRTITQKRKDK